MSEYEVFLLPQIVTELFKSSIPATSKPYMNFSKLDTMDLKLKTNTEIFDPLWLYVKETIVI
jgi:hypothetical protein